MCERWYKSSFVIFIMFCVFVIGVVSALAVYDHVAGHAESEISVEAVRLLFVSDAPESAVVHGSLLFSVTPSVLVEFGGDVESMSITAYNADIIYADGTKIVRYDGLLALKEPVSAGDEIDLVIRHGGSETVLSIVVETGGSETRIVAEVGGA